MTQPKQSMLNKRKWGLYILCNQSHLFRIEMESVRRPYIKAGNDSHLFSIIIYYCRNKTIPFVKKCTYYGEVVWRTKKSHSISFFKKAWKNTYIAKVHMHHSKNISKCSRLVFSIFAKTNQYIRTFAIVYHECYPKENTIR